MSAPPDRMPLCASERRRRNAPTGTCASRWSGRRCSSASPWPSSRRRCGAALVSAAYYGPAGPPSWAAERDRSRAAGAVRPEPGAGAARHRRRPRARVAYIPTTVAAGVCEPVRRCVPPEVRATVVNNGAAGGIRGPLGALVGASSRGCRARAGGVRRRSGSSSRSPRSDRLGGRVAPRPSRRRARGAAGGVLRAHRGGGRDRGVAAASRRVRRARACGGVRGRRGGDPRDVRAARAGIVAGVERSGFPVVFVGESIALALFGVFWVVQTVEFWNEADPGLRE